MSGYQDYLDALEVLGSAAERAARAREQAGDYGRDDLRHAALDRREHEQEWDRILTEATHLSRSAQTLARSHGLPVAEAAEAPGVPADPPRDLAGCGRAVRSLRADLDAAQELWRGVDTAQVAPAPVAPPAPPAAPAAPISPTPVPVAPLSPAPSAEPAPAPASPALKLVLAVVLVIAVVCGIIAFA